MNNKKKCSEPKVIKLRSKKDLIKVQGCFNKDSEKPIQFEFIATPEDWQSLSAYIVGCFFLNDIKKLQSNIDKIVYSALDVIEGKRKLRGKHKYNYNLVNSIRITAAFLYPYLQYWCQKPTEEWPASLKDVIRMAKEEELEEALRQQKRKDRYSPLSLTAYCIDKRYGEEAKKGGLEHFDMGCIDNLESFSLTYIFHDNRHKAVYNDYIKDNKIDELERLLYSFIKVFPLPS